MEAFLFSELQSGFARLFFFSELQSVFARLEQLHFSLDISTFEMSTENVEQEAVENVRAPQSVDTIQDMLLNFLTAFFLPSAQGRRKMFSRDICNIDAIFNLATRYCRLAHLLKEYVVYYFI